MMPRLLRDDMIQRLLSLIRAEQSGRFADIPPDSVRFDIRQRVVTSLAR